jgi:hypothetical protein
VQPQIPRLGDVERQVIVVLVAPADEHLEPADHHRPVRATLARHVTHR